jgi:hypothetical protein
MVQPRMSNDINNSKPGVRIAAIWIATIASWATFQVLLFLALYRLGVECNIINPGGTHWYKGFINEFTLFGLGPCVTFFGTLAGCLWLRWPHGGVKTAFIRAVLTTFWSTFVSLPISCLIAFNLWGT